MFNAVNLTRAGDTIAVTVSAADYPYLLVVGDGTGTG